MSKPDKPAPPAPIEWAEKIRTYHRALKANPERDAWGARWVAYFRAVEEGAPRVLAVEAELVRPLEGDPVFELVKRWSAVGQAVHEGRGEDVAVEDVETLLGEVEAPDPADEEEGRAHVADLVELRRAVVRIFKGRRRTRRSIVLGTRGRQRAASIGDRMVKMCAWLPSEHFARIDREWCPVNDWLGTALLDPARIVAAIDRAESWARLAYDLPERRRGAGVDLRRRWLVLLVAAHPDGRTAKGRRRDAMVRRWPALAPLLNASADPFDQFNADARFRKLSKRAQRR